MNKKWMPITAGILDIIAAVVYGGIPGYVVIWEIYKPLYGYPFPGGFGIFDWMGLVGIPAGILAIIGGVHAIIRKRWWLALAGSVAISIPVLMLWGFLAITQGSAIPAIALFTSEAIIGTELWLIILVFSGIPAIVLTVLSKKQFT
jgi:hypothetical protein